MSRATVYTNPVHVQTASDADEPFMQVTTYPDRTTVHMRATRGRAHGFVLMGEVETRHLIAALEASLAARAAMPPSAADQALAEVCAMCDEPAPVNLKSNAEHHPVTR